MIQYSVEQQEKTAKDSDFCHLRETYTTIMGKKILGTNYNCMLQNLSLKIIP